LIFFNHFRTLVRYCISNSVTRALTIVYRPIPVSTWMKEMTAKETA